MVEEGTFRQDLLYRINTVEIYLPPLRERLGDLPTLAQHYLQKYSKKYKKSAQKLQASALERLQEHHWPGNVRELQHAIERAVIMSDAESLQAEDFFFLAPKSQAATPVAAALVSQNLNLDDMEKAAIQKAVQKYNGNISKAAKELGLTRASLYRRLEKYGL